MKKEENYSAVILADMVAEVPISPADLELKKRSSIHKECHNYAFEGPVENGLILNVPSLNASELTAKSPPVVDVPKVMSTMRKVAFGLSFLPSVMFVLCFAIILPCEEMPQPEPCVRQRWHIVLHDAVMTSKVTFPEDVILTYSRSGLNFVASFNASTGRALWNTTLRKSDVGSIDCDSFQHENGCLVMDESRYLYTLDAFTGNVLHTRHMAGTSNNCSFPTILPGCNGNTGSIIAAPVSYANIQIGVFSNDGYTIAVPPCAEFPSQLMPWTSNDSTELLYYYCKDKDMIDKIEKVSQNEWCASKTNAVNVFDLIRHEDLTHSISLVTDNGFLVWTEKFVFMISSDGNQIWNASSGNHSMNRFLKYGRFFGDENQVALFSSDSDSNSLITTLNPMNGTITWSKSISDVEISDVHLINGKEKDFVIMIIHKMKTDLAKEVTATIVNFLSNDTFSNLTSTRNSTIIEQIALMELGSQYPFHTLQDKEISLGNVKNKNYPAAKFAVNIDGNILRIVIASSIESVPDNVQIQLRGITVENWDIASTASKCTLQ